HPRIKNRLADQLKNLHVNILQVDPAGYFHLLQLLDNCRFVLTDSGGLQKEAFWAKKPCITLRDETEWVETVAAGWNVLWNDFQGFDRYGKKDVTPYGEGHAAERIVEVISQC
ncbi:MAG: UDP-N-acetylglucosamine 2-epimerase, partial [Bacteroidales bacterium]|nr:UDP-N-acetylglucosamine 2-epimerase [Bacteroidales bacterium]